MASEVAATKESCAAELDWVEANRETIAARYAGEFIAVDGHAIVAHGRDLHAVMSSARDTGHPRPLIVAVPTEPITRLHV